ncbi:hypothetical protein [Clostridium sp. B9]|uniref:hypothetical protein n=1 Tax=Clostridium sp. B9 TaxID=3423224 RepID=UPI003D2F34CE
MKSGIKFISLILLSVFFAWIICFFTSKDGKYLYSERFEGELLLRGLKGAEAMCSDGKGNLYIAIKNNIFSVDKNSNMRLELREEANNIYDLEYYEGTLYYTVDGKLISYKISTKENKTLLDGIPNNGINKMDTMILLKDGNIYLTIPSNTNSGVVDSEGGGEDIPPVDTVLNGRNYDENRKGVFSPFNTKTSKGQVIKGGEVGNASVYRIDLKTNKKELYSYGLRNIKGIDYSNDGDVFIIVGGIEESGYRPLSGDCDYLYKLDKNTWYGWPDYSGGDPVSSPRFREEGKPKVNFVTDQHKSYIMPSPIYQNESVGSINSLLVDREGIVGEKDSFIIFDSEKNSIIGLLSTGEEKEIIIFENGAYVDDMKFIGDSLYLLDGEKGLLFKVIEKNNGFNDNLKSYIILIFVNSIFICSLGVKLVISLRKNKM